MDDNRVEVDLGDPVRVIGGKAGERDHQMGERVTVGGRLAAHPVEQRGALQLAEQVERLLGAERNRREGDVLQDLNMDATEPDHQHRPEIGVAADAENDVAAAPRHRLYEDAVDLGAGMGRPCARQYRAVAVAHRGLAADAENDRAGLGLVQDVGRLHLQRHRAANPCRRRDRLGFVCCQRLGRRRHAVMGQQCLRGHLSQHRTGLGERISHRLARRRGGWRRGRPTRQPPLECAVIDQGAERPGAARHRGVAGDAGAGEGGDRRRARGRIGA